LRQLARRAPQRRATRPSRRPSPRSLAEADFSSKAGAKFLAPLLFAGALDHRTIADVISWIDDEAADKRRVGDILTTNTDAPEPDRKAALTAAGAVWNADDRLRSSRT
jgi:hypothetical protein